MILNIGDYVIDSDFDICRIDNITEHNIEISYIERSSGMIFRPTFTLNCDWAKDIVRTAEPSEIVVAKFKGLI